MFKETEVSGIRKIVQYDTRTDLIKMREKISLHLNIPPLTSHVFLRGNPPFL